MSASPEVAITPEALQAAVTTALGDRASSVTLVRGEVTAVVPASAYLEAMRTLRDAPGCRFDQLMDLCGMDYSAYRDGLWEGQRYAVVVHLLSVALNQRVRVRVFCPTTTSRWWPRSPRCGLRPTGTSARPSTCFGIVFDGHDDLRRILTDYGFIGHPFRKDFPLSGHVEMRYDPERRRVIYEPVSIEPREITPRVMREDNYGGLH
jgi:NADH-quinone oxidoreductase subunit C